MNTPILEYGPRHEREYGNVHDRQAFTAGGRQHVGVILIVMAVTALATATHFCRHPRSLPMRSCASSFRIRTHSASTRVRDAAYRRKSSPRPCRAMPKSRSSRAAPCCCRSIKKYKQDILVTPDQMPFLGRISELLSIPASRCRPSSACGRSHGAAKRWTSIRSTCRRATSTRK